MHEPSMQNERSECERSPFKSHKSFKKIWNLPKQVQVIADPHQMDSVVKLVNLMYLYVKLLMVLLNHYIALHLHRHHHPLLEIDQQKLDLKIKFKKCSHFSLFFFLLFCVFRSNDNKKVCNGAPKNADKKNGTIIILCTLQNKCEENIKNVSSLFLSLYLILPLFVKLQHAFGIFVCMLYAHQGKQTEAQLKDNKWFFKASWAYNLHFYYYFEEKKMNEEY